LLLGRVLHTHSEQQLSISSVFSKPQDTLNDKQWQRLLVGDDGVIFAGTHVSLASTSIPGAFIDSSNAAAGEDVAPQEFFILGATTVRMRQPT